MTVLVPLTLFGWVPFVLLLFVLLPPRRAVIAAFLIAWLFLPDAGYRLPGLPDYTKMFATCVGVLLGAALFDMSRLTSFRPRWFDLPILVLCVTPFASSLSNDLGAYDGLTWVVAETVRWGLPYFIGRVYFSDAEALRELAIGIFISGLVYIPICAFEIKMSPQLSRWVYGINTGWAGTRLGGWRPQGFMNSGLMLAMWMTSATLCGIWLWATGSLTQLGKLKMYWAVPILFLTTVLCRSSGAIGLMLGGTAILFTCRWFRTAVPLLCLLVVPPVYSWARASGAWDGSDAVNLAGSVLEPARAQSLRFRFKNENMLAEKALEQPWFGWGRWGRSRIYDEWGKDITTTDGLWIITFGQTGLVGLIAVTSIYLLPALLLWKRHPVAEWSTPRGAAVAVLTLILLLYAVDNLLNAKINPICALCMGALNGLMYIPATELAVIPAAAVAAAAMPPRRFQRRLWPPRPIDDPGPAGSHGERTV